MSHSAPQYRFVFALLASLSITALAAGQATQPGPPGPNPRVPWLHEGLVFSGIWTAASHPGHATDFKQDDNGNWVGTDGARLNASDHLGTSAGGVTQTVISCIGQEKVVIVNYAFTDMRLLGQKDPVQQSPPTTYAVDMGLCELWVEPGKLAQARSDPNTHTIVAALKWKARGQLVDAIRVSSVTQQGYIDHVYEAASGICLHAGVSSTGAAPQMKYMAPGDTRGGDTQLTSYDFLALRDNNTPWATEALPAWTSQFKTLHYTGEIRPFSRLLGGPTEVGLDVSRIDSGNGWVSMSTSGFAIKQGRQVFPTKGLFIEGRDGFDGFFAGPASLATLRQGQVLDTDPITHNQTTVSAMDANSVTIVTANSVGEVSRTYDRQTGKVVAFSRTSNFTKTTTSFRLQGEE